MEGERAAPTPQIEFTGVSMVKPESPPPIHRMFLSNLDLFWSFANLDVQCVIFYKISQKDENSSVVERLKKSLSSVLEHFYPMAGRLAVGKSGRLEVDCNNEGVEFIEATANIPFEELEKGGFQYKPYFNNLASTTTPAGLGKYSRPVLTIQITSFLDGGGISIGTSHHHVLADGISFCHFLKSWGECSRGLPVSNPPLHKRTLLKGEYKSLSPLSLQPLEISNDRVTGAQILKLVPDVSQSGHDKTMNGTAAEGDPRKESFAKWQHKDPPLKYSTFLFTRDMIREIKQRTGASTSFIGLAAHFWRSMVKAREIPEEELVNFLLWIDGRSRVNPPLPPTYFGNFLNVCIGRTTAKKLLTEDTSFAAEVIKEAVSSCTEVEHIDSFRRWVEESPERKLPMVCAELARGYSTSVVGSMRMPVYETDFGWGNPVQAQMLAVPEIGVMSILGARDEFVVPVSTCLPGNAMDKLTQILLH